MGSFLKTASKQVSDVRSFLRESAGGNSIKYAAEKGAKHIIYIPYTTETVVNDDGSSTVEKKICAIQGKVHEWSTQDGKFKATVCTKGIVITGDDGTTLVNDGSCPFCDRVTDAWDIYRYRKELEEATCPLTGDARKNHLEKTFSSYADERKAKDPRNYMYILVVKYKINDNGAVLIGTDGLPEYDLKVMKLSSSRVEKIEQQLTNSGSTLADSELVFEYPNVEDRRLLVSQSTTAPVFPNNMITVKYPALVNKINEDVAKFDWDGLEKAFPEWAGMTSLESKKIMDSAFEEWDKYKKELAVDPSAKYLEYVVKSPATKPNIGADMCGAIPVIPTIPTVPTVPGAPAVPTVPTTPAAPTIPVVPAAPTAPVAPEVPVAPVAPVTDPNAVFAGSNAQAPTVNV